MSVTPPLYEQLRRGTGRNRVVAWLAEHSYRAALASGASFGLAIGLSVGLGPLVPSLTPGRAFSLAGLVIDLLMCSAFSVVVALIATASARVLVRGYARTRYERGPS